jgi:hypothetical protein
VVAQDCWVGATVVGTFVYKGGWHICIGCFLKSKEYYSTVQYVLVDTSAGKQTIYDMELANLALTGFLCEYFLGMARSRA